MLKLSRDGGPNMQMQLLLRIQRESFCLGTDGVKKCLSQNTTSSIPMKLLKNTEPMHSVSTKCSSVLSNKANPGIQKALTASFASLRNSGNYFLMKKEILLRMMKLQQKMN